MPNADVVIGVVTGVVTGVVEYQTLDQSTASQPPVRNGLDLGHCASVEVAIQLE